MRGTGKPPCSYVGSEHSFAPTYSPRQAPSEITNIYGIGLYNADSLLLPQLGALELRESTGFRDRALRGSQLASWHNSGGETHDHSEL